MDLPIQRSRGGPLLSTGKAARLLSVTPDTVLKWIKSGRLSAVRTAGGHYRVARKDVDRLLGTGAVTRPAKGRGLFYCWEYYATDGDPSEGCLSCLVYRARARRCYEMSSLASESGYAGTFCTTSCEACAYYREVVMRPRRVLVVTASEALRRRLARDSEESRLELAFVDGEYECSAALERFKPEYVVIDGALSDRTRTSLCANLASDTRIEGVEIILAIEGESAGPRSVEQSVDGALPRAFSLVELEQHITGVGVKPVATA